MISQQYIHSSVFRLENRSKGLGGKIMASQSKGGALHTSYFSEGAAETQGGEKF